MYIPETPGRSSADQVCYGDTGKGTLPEGSPLLKTKDASTERYVGGTNAGLIPIPIFRLAPEVVDPLGYEEIQKHEEAHDRRVSETEEASLGQ
jgi:hypothetical protein